MAVMLNQRLVAEQKLTKADEAKIQKLHERLGKLFAFMETLEPNSGDREYLQSFCVPEIQKIEFEMQAAWKWEQTADKHIWWRRAPHCKCPHMDNQDRFGTKYRVISGDCPLHGAK